MLQELTDPVSRLRFGGFFALDLDFFLVCAKTLFSGRSAERRKSFCSMQVFYQQHVDNFKQAF